MKDNKGFIGVGLILAIILGVAVVGGGTYYLTKSSNLASTPNAEKNISSNILSDSFTIEMYGNYSSSGADRNYQGELTFKNNKLISGSQNYSVGEGGNCKENCNRKTECLVKDQQWVDKTTGEKCEILDTFSAPLTKEELEQKIIAKEFVQSENFDDCHSRICYKIKELDITDSKNNPKISKSDDPYGRYIGKDSNNNISTNFNFIFKYGVGGGNILDTFTETYTKDMITEEPVKIDLKLSEIELQNIYNKIIELDLFNKTPLQKSNIQRTPCSSFYLKTEINSSQKELSWNDCNGEIKEDFNQFTDYVIKIIESKIEYQKLPPIKGGYM